MRAGFRKASAAAESASPTREGCFILEIANDPGDEAVSIARARVRPGVSTELHRLNGVAERYVIVAGTGRVELGGVGSGEVSAGDVVRIPPGTSQRITNLGDGDLVFYCVCSPPFTPSCYEPLA
jgi:mannose-6-phosphate isomerase-like protein (cupin superfamily)